MRLFKCEIVRNEKEKPQSYTLTGDELVEYLNNEKFTVHKAEKITADEEKIEEIMREKLQEAYKEILSHHSLQTGDITPLQQEEIDSNEEKLVETAQNWIKTRLN